ncbi:hypothetical protein QQ008_02150 [Fulvivirgaceae bacterium BMA10]|uniref:Uncharacterized protein n=1 Tax=Splendidivirga corallicola TaxID=3051826 RepID=A0ABT8KHD9_9BACT|nr:hypothetical protein [Fulvivirgaceae bacterium BMA10]
MGAIISKKVVAFETWQKALTIHPGYSVYIHYKEGLWNINPGKHGPEMYGPEGGPVITENPKYPMIGVNEGCLLGRVIFPKNYESNNSLDLLLKDLDEGNNENEILMFPINRDGFLVPKTDFPKTLYLRCNDIDSGIFDNEGELVMELEIW